jgi:hypothetical protein
MRRSPIWISRDNVIRIAYRCSSSGITSIRHICSFQMHAYEGHVVFDLLLAPVSDKVSKEVLASREILVEVIAILSIYSLQ